MAKKTDKQKKTAEPAVDISALQAEVQGLRTDNAEMRDRLEEIAQLAQGMAVAGDDDSEEDEDLEDIDEGEDDEDELEEADPEEEEEVAGSVPFR